MTRDELSALLPFYVNGTLDAHERAELETALDADENLQAEVAALRAIRTTMQAEETQSPGEFGLAKLMRDDALNQTTHFAPVQHFWKIAAAVLLAVVVGQTVLQTDGSGIDGSYQLAGDTVADFTIAVLPDTTEAALRALLLEAGVEIVTGPTALGLYGLAVVPGADAEQAFETLQGSSLLETVQKDAE